MKFKKQSGQALVGTAIAMVVLCGFAGLAIDMGTLRYQKRLQQTAADSAAIAGAQNLSFGSGVSTGAQNASTQNGFTDNDGGAGCTGSGDTVGCVSVAINNGPANGPHAGNALYVEAIVSAIQPTYFMKIFGTNGSLVIARAVATNMNGGINSNCLYTIGLPTAAITGIDVQGHAYLSAPNCGIADNGNFDPTGSSYTVTAATFSVSGDCTGNAAGCKSGTLNKDVTCTAMTDGNCGPLKGAPATEDPEKGLALPSQPPASPTCPNLACNWTSPDYPPSSTAPPVTIQPGTYSSINIGKNSNVIMAPGLYYINGSGGLGFGGGGTLTNAGNPGVMIYFTNGATLNKVNGGGSVPDVNLTPMTSDQAATLAGSSTYGGILFFQDPNDLAQPWFGGDNNSTYNGTVYFPTQTVTFYGNAAMNFNGTVIVYSIAINGSPIVNFGVSPAGIPVPATLTKAILVE